MSSSIKLTKVLLLLAVASCDSPESTSPLPVQASHVPAGPVVLGAPLFGIEVAPDGSILAAVASAGVTRIRRGDVELMTPLPGVNDVAVNGWGNVYAVTGGSTDPGQILPTSRKLFMATHGGAEQIADLWQFEQDVNPDGFWHTGVNAVESNPFDVAVLRGRTALIADAAANAIIIVNEKRAIDWVAVLTPATAGGPEPVPTSIAIGPDGAYYVGELTGFPGTAALSRVWRIAPGSRHVVCPSAACTVVASGFTSIIDIAFSRDGTLYVVELDEASWFALELNGFTKAAGGTVNQCNVQNGACTVLAGNLSLPTSIAIDNSGRIWITEHEPMLFAAARVRPL